MPATMKLGFVHLEEGRIKTVETSYIYFPVRASEHTYAKNILSAITVSDGYAPMREQCRVVGVWASG